MYIIRRLITIFFKKIFRHLFWIYNLFRIKSKGKLLFDLPLRIEGKGNITTQEYVTLGKNVNLLIAGNLTISKKSIIGERVRFCIGTNGELVIGDNSQVEEGCILYLKNKKWKIGNHVFISLNTVIQSREAGYEGCLKIEDNCHIGNGCIIDMTDNITIEQNVSIGTFCTIYTHNHNYMDMTVSAWEGGILPAPVYIKEGAWIGSNVTILPGVVIGRHSVVAAGAVVTKNIPDFSVYGGVPAKQLKIIN